MRRGGGSIAGRGGREAGYEDKGIKHHHQERKEVACP